MTDSLCPMCAECIGPEDFVCRHCGSVLRSKPRVQVVLEKVVAETVAMPIRDLPTAQSPAVQYRPKKTARSPKRDGLIVAAVGLIAAILVGGFAFYSLRDEGPTSSPEISTQTAPNTESEDVSPPASVPPPVAPTAPAPPAAIADNNNAPAAPEAPTPEENTPTIAAAVAPAGNTIPEGIPPYSAQRGWRCVPQPNAVRGEVLRRAIGIVRRGTVSGGDGQVFLASCEMTPSEVSSAFNQGGLSAHRAQDWARAVELWRQAVRIDPSKLAARYNLSCGLALLGRSDDAMAQLRQIRRAGNDAEEWFSRARRDSDLNLLRGRDDFQALLNQ